MCDFSPQPFDGDKSLISFTPRTQSNTLTVTVTVQDLEVRDSGSSRSFCHISGNLMQCLETKLQSGRAGLSFCVCVGGDRRQRKHR